MITCYIGLGSNLGERRLYIQLAIKELKKLFSTRVTKVSSIIETKPAGGPEQGLYLNGVVEIQTDLTPYQLLQELQRIESFLGRVRTVVNGPRTIDLDILLYGDYCIQEEALCIPHPRMLERDFVLDPLREIAPQVMAFMLRKNPGKGKKEKAGIRNRKTKVKKEKIQSRKQGAAKKKSKAKR